ncbi:serine/threonine-protein phosphatase [Erwinia tracheiphila]|uniref:PppA n=1 Tax=Erwinia tracheiphila TaxID=65700 RepID=A0A0M2KBY3_9GAMM|nr:PP2C family serine/threonine-protein phosphatase [Erwinia tracheiphila]AXF76007.1 serine/threonine-protein phosphatase [Erwinia tracheiphila]EOS96743.1 protein phosphatase 2C-like protein [Erwinia tracheiphila PSU-1]KKF34797.1 PppA [Erwinia tracheiphila]UIA85333.1 serine/threonine-protein phosphatase [Erwinia tracheiphila]UIA86468.1 serine/threonine-protein phosphatase [Erwinia tracheiphila]
MNINYSAMSHKGQREHNQDKMGAILQEHCACFLVCDGVAGTAGGEIAARITRDALLSRFTDDAPVEPADTERWVADAQQAVRQAQQSMANFSNMSTTLAALFINRDTQQSWWIHAGDSRVYHFRRGYIHSHTRDHSLVQQLKDAGVDNTGINSNLLYNALGAEVPHPFSCSGIHPLEDGDAFLVCTDGFWCNLTPEEMEQALRMVNSPEEWLALMHAAISRSKKEDNLSAVAIWIGSPQEATLIQLTADSARFLPPRK